MHAASLAARNARADLSLHVGLIYGFTAAIALH